MPTGRGDVSTLGLSEIMLSMVSGLISGLLFTLAAPWLVRLGGDDPPTRSLAILLAALGSTVLTSNLAAAGGGTWTTVASEALVLFVPLSLIGFVHSTTRSPERSVRLAFGLSATAAISGALMLAARPDQFFLSSESGAKLLSANGVWSLVFGQLPYYAAVGLGALIFLGRAIRQTNATEARHGRLLAAGLLCFLGAATTWFGMRALPALPEYLDTRGGTLSILVVLLFATSTAFLVAAGVHIHRAPMRREDRRLLALALYVPLATSAAAALVLLAGGPRVNPVGFWRIVMVALIVLAVMRHRLFDGEVRFKRTAIATLTIFFGVGLALLAEGIVRAAGVSAFTDPIAALGVGAVFAAGVTVPYLPATQRAARRAFRALVEPHDPSRAQDLEVYRAALEARAARGESLRADEPDLARLRSELRVEAREHDLLMMFVERRRAAPPAFEPGARILDGTLTVEREIGAGASARVYEARDETGRAVAVKVQAPLLHGAGEAGARAVREARMLDGLRSANVLPVVEVADRPEAFYVVTERAAGTLADKITATPKLAPAEAIAIARDVLTGLAAAHRAGIVHRDVKPANVLLTPDGRAVLADFDAATSVGERAAARGTPAWMAPEQFDGDATPASDVHAVGALLFRLLAGRHYVRVDGLNEVEMRLLITRAEPALPAEWPADVRAWLAKALAKDAAERWPDASAALAALPRVTP